MKRNNEPKAITDVNALHLLSLNGQSAPSADRVKITQLILETCAEYEIQLSSLNEPLYPALEWWDIEMFYAIEHGLNIEIDVDDPAWRKNETFADLVANVEARVIFLRNVVANEKAKIASANCETQAAFYALRHRLCRTGAAYHTVHNLRPTLPLVEIPAKHAEPLAESLAKDFNLSLPLRRVVWNRVDTGALQWVFFFASVVACFYVAPVLPLPFLTGAVLCVLANVAFARLVGRHARTKWPRKYQTLGDVARKIALLSSAPQAAS